jgi:hypothetical protein
MSKHTDTRSEKITRRNAVKVLSGAMTMTIAAGLGEEARAQAARGTQADEDGPITDETVYELRIYHLNEGKQAAILDRFHTKERAIFARLGMHGVAYWVPTDEPLKGRTLTYMLRHKNRAAADAAWNAFRADPEWKALQAETEKDGAFVKQHDITFMKLTDFSPKI